MRTTALACVLAVVGGLWLSGCSTAPKSQVGRENLDAEVNTAIQTAKNKDPGLQHYFDTAAGYAVFPSVGTGAYIVGGAYGQGILFEKGERVGYCSLTQASVGLAVGGAAYTELIFLQTPEAVNKFKAGQLNFTATAKAVALEAGAAATASYSKSVLVFTMGQKGLLVSASIGGQKFSYQPLGAVPPTAPSPTARAPQEGTEAGTAGTAGTTEAPTKPTSATTEVPQ